MVKSKEQKLFAQFPPVPTEQWEKAIAADLKGADYEKKLVWKTDEGFNVKPYYRAEDLSGITFLGNKAGSFPYLRGVKECNDWLVHQTIEVKSPEEAGATARDVISRGAGSIGFRIKGKDLEARDMDALLAGIDPIKTETGFSGCKTTTKASLFLEKMAKEKADPAVIRAWFDIDPIIKKLTLKGAMCKSGNSFEKLADLIRGAAEYKKVRLVGINGQVFHNSGSTIVQELAFTLSAGHEYIVKLMEQGLTIDQIASRTRFTMAVSSNYFMEIAKFRAARMLWANIVAGYDPKCCCSAKMMIHAETSRWNMTVYDPYVNMLRGTTESMSAAIAGVHSMEVLPFDAPYEAPTEFSSRIARNTQLVLKEESHFNLVTDPSGGSYYIENLTRSIAENTWKLFLEIEDKGGYIAALEAGMIQEMVEASASKKDMNIASRRRILLGTNQYPNFNEKAGVEVDPGDVIRYAEKNCGCECSSEAEAKVRTLKLYRGAMAFEEIRLRVDRSGREPKAFMLTVGNLSMARARAQFACNFFACAGIRVQDNTYFHDLDQGIKEALAAKAEIVVICASDDDYATLAPAAFEKLGGKAILVVAGAPACQPELEAAGIGHFISVRSNVLETLKGYLKELGIL